MPGGRGIVYRGRRVWPPIVAMLVAFGFAWLMGCGLAVACIVDVAANFVVAMLAPQRRFGRWTE